MKTQGEALSFGKTWHRRLRPVDRSFSYGLMFLWLPMRRWKSQGLVAAPARNRWGWVSFYDRDHGLGGPDALAWVEQLLQEQGIQAEGEIWLQTLPRVLGFGFKPVSFWHVEHADGRLAALLVEVNNTFGERHCYLLRSDGTAASFTQSPDGYRWQGSADKVFHVSPFCATQGRYHFEFRAMGNWRSARINLADEQGPLMKTSLCGRLEPYNPQRVRRYVWQMPWAALAVIWRIHWQAVQLFWLRLPFFRQPPAPEQFVSE